MARSFDIAETQFLANYPGDLYPWHGRILFEQLDGATWLGYSPDVDDGPQEVDLNFEVWDFVPRNSLLPAARASCLDRIWYTFRSVKPAISDLLASRTRSIGKVPPFTSSMQ